MRGELADVAESGEVVDGNADVHRGGGEVAGDEGMVELADAALLELFDEGAAGIVGFGEEKTAGGILVQAMDGAEGGDGELVAQAGFDGFVADGEEARGFVGDEEEGIVEQDAEGGVAFGGGGNGVGEDGDGVADLEEVASHPDAAAVDEDEAVVEEGCGGAARKGEGIGEVVEEGGAVAADGRQGAKGGRFLGRAFHWSSLKGEKSVWWSKGSAASARLRRRTTA